jgi:hypothetical protein
MKMVLPQEQAWTIGVDDMLDCELDCNQISLFTAETGTAIRRDGTAAAG